MTLNDLHNTWFQLTTQKSAFVTAKDQNQCGTVADLGEGPGGPRGARPLLFLDQTETRRAENNFLRPPLSQGVDDRHRPFLSEGLDPPLWYLTFLCPGGNITDPHISLTHVTVEKPKVYSRPTSVRQNLYVATLGRLGPKRLTALKRKRRVAHPVRLKVKDVALGFVTFSML